MTIDVNEQEMVLLINLILAHVVQLRRKQPDGDLFEATLLQKLQAVDAANTQEFVRNRKAHGV